MNDISRIIARCPVEVAMERLSKKWVIHILRDMFRGKTRFTEFLNGIPGISTKVLSQRLKELEDDGLVTKIVTATTPVSINYYLTENGLALQRVIIELSLFAIHQFPNEVFASDHYDFERAEEEAYLRFSTPALISDLVNEQSAS